MIGMSIPRNAIRVSSSAGRHVTSPSLITNAPTGRARTPKPAPPPESAGPEPPPPPPETDAAGMMVSPSFSIGTP